MKLFDVYCPGIPKMTLSGVDKLDVQQSVLDYVRAFYPRRKWQLENITVVGLGVQS